MDKHKIISKSSWATWNLKAKEKKLTDTLRLTLTYFQKGLTIQQIAKKRKLKQDTIERQIIELITKGFLYIGNVLGEEKTIKILNFIKEENIHSLKKIYEDLDQEFTYFQIKATIAYLNIEPRKL